MTAIAATGHYSAGLRSLGPLQAGVSDAAIKIYEILTRTTAELFKSATGQARIADPLAALQDIFDQCTINDWDGAGSSAIPYSAFQEAVRLLCALPSTIPAPEVLPEPTGSIAFEWYRGPARTYVLSVRGNHSIEYAGLFGPGNEVHGRNNFEGLVPNLVLEHFRALFRK